MHLPILIGPNIQLRPLRRADIPALVRGANDPTIAKFIPPIAHPYTADHARRWVNHVQRCARRDQLYQFAIEPIDKPGLIGMAGLNNLNWNDQNAELEIWLTKAYRGHALATESVRLLLSFAFGELSLHRVYAIMVCINERSVRLLERLAFVREATWRKASRMDDSWHDVYCYGMLEEEFK